MLEERAKAGLPNSTWKTGEDVFRWWTGQTPKNQEIDGQLSLFAEDGAQEYISMEE